MNVAHFEEIQAVFMDRVSEAVYCNVATIDRAGRPRSRVMHLIWDGPMGWAISNPASHKAKHLADHPAVSLAYIHNPMKPVYVDCLAAWVDEISEKRRVWDLHRMTPLPLGFDPEPHYGSIDHPFYGLLRFIPWRLELGDLSGEPTIWRSPDVINSFKRVSA